MSLQSSRASALEARGGALPDFLIIGAMKCGTTSLYHYLRDHPQIFMPTIKAPEFFAEESNWGRGIAWYRRQFEGAGPEVPACICTMLPATHFHNSWPLPSSAVK